MNKIIYKRKTSSTIPFGYKQSESMEGFMEPVPEQLSALEEAKGHIISGALSVRGAAEQLQYRTGRSISAVGLKKIVDKEKKALKDYNIELKKLNSILNSIKN